MVKLNFGVTATTVADVDAYAVSLSLSPTLALSFSDAGDGMDEVKATHQQASLPKSVSLCSSTAYTCTVICEYYEYILFCNTCERCYDALCEYNTKYMYKTVYTRGHVSRTHYTDDAVSSSSCAYVNA